MRVVLSTYGSRGDVEPLAALAVQLRERGAEAVVCAPPDDDFARLLERAGVPLVGAGQAVREMIAEVTRKQGPNVGRRLPLEELQLRARRIVATQYEAVLSALGGSAGPDDVVVGTGLMPAACGARSAADRVGARWVSVRFQPTTLPSPHHRPYPYPGRPLPEGETDNRVLWEYDRETMKVVFGGVFDEHRVGVGLETVDDVREYVFTRQPWLAADPLLAPWPDDAGADAGVDFGVDVVQTGAWILPDRRRLPEDLRAFLDAGEPPVYVGFGSMGMQQELKGPGRLAIEAAREHGRRVVVHAGWAGLGLSDDGDDCLAVGEINQQALFARCAAVVHHGGAGTTTTATRAGAPQVVPQVVDQPYFAARVAELGIGVAHDGPVPSADSLSQALGQALEPGTARRAREVSGLIRTDGTRVAAGLLGVG
ncbi:glycosyltransferase [Kineosporia corallincola]